MKRKRTLNQHTDYFINDDVICFLPFFLPCNFVFCSGWCRTTLTLRFPIYMFVCIFIHLGYCSFWPGFHFSYLSSNTFAYLPHRTRCGKLFQYSSWSKANKAALSQWRLQKQINFQIVSVACGKWWIWKNLKKAPFERNRHRSFATPTNTPTHTHWRNTTI